MRKNKDNYRGTPQSREKCLKISIKKTTVIFNNQLRGSENNGRHQNT